MPLPSLGSGGGDRVTAIFETRLKQLVAAGPNVLAGGSKGVEKESLRIWPDGRLAATPHPTALGSALCSGFITTDFSEALLEFVTPAYASSRETLHTLTDIHRFAAARIGTELLWPASMPCRIPADRDIPLARYGDSNVGRMKTIYRRGLGYRYGRAMQTIAGLHFNYSLPGIFWPVYRGLRGDTGPEDEFRSREYLALVRNFRRFGWLILYLFGASPALCRSFAGTQTADMPSLNGETLFEPYGTSLRMSDLGYSNKAQAGIHISLNSLEEYVRDLSAAIRTPEPGYEAIGVKVDGEYRQLNTNKLQIENEYYSAVRPKRVARSGERPTMALKRGGIEYIEIRSLDLSLADPAGINQDTMHVIEAFLVYCLLEESPPFDADELARCAHNQLRTAKAGRQPGLKLARSCGTMPLKDWALEMLDAIARVAELIDAGDRRGGYAASVDGMRELVLRPETTPSGRLLAALAEQGLSYFDYALDIARHHRDYFGRLGALPAARLAEFEREAKRSLDQQAAIEAADAISLDEYLEHYFANGGSMCN